MQIKKGYKQTQIGVIPEDWEVKKLMEVAKVKTGPFGSTLHEKDYVEDGTPIITVEHLGEFGVIHENLPMVSDFDKYRLNTYALQTNDIVFSRVGSVDRNSLIREKENGWLFSGRLLRIRINKRVINPTFLSYFFHHEPSKQRIRSVAVGQTMPSLNTTILNVIDIIIPSLPEQQAIAAALSDVDALISSLDQLITKKRNIKQGAMQELLTGKKRLAGFTGEWDEKKLGEIAEITKLAGFEYTNYFNSYKDGGEIIVIRGTNITNNKLDLSEIKTIPKSTSNKLQRSKLQKYDLVFAYVGTIGPVYLIDENDKYHLGPNTARITVNKEMLPQFALCYFTSAIIKNEIIEHTSVGAQPSLSMSKVRKFKIPVPPLPEQQAIAAILSDMDAEIEKLEQQRDKYKAINQGMMQELLTGKTRLI